MKKKIIIIVSIILALGLSLSLWGIAVNNSASKKEEQIFESKSSISIQLKKRNDSINQLVQVVEKFSEHEQNIIDSVTEARKMLNEGNISGATSAISIIVENYPEIKSVESYNNLMHQIAINENGIAQYRDNYNQQVKSYKKFIKVFPNTMFLSIGGYTPIEVDYFVYEDENNLNIDNIFGD